MKVWGLAGDKWKKVLIQHRGKIKKKHIDSLNTPRAEQIDALFESMIGLKGISSVWYWPGMSNVKAKKRLSDLITLRGSIAHRVATSKTVNKKYATDQSLFIQRLAAQAHNKTLSFIESRTSEKPWSYYSFGKVY